MTTFALSLPPAVGCQNGDYLEDGATLELLWKWGMDGQTGALKYYHLRAELKSCWPPAVSSPGVSRLSAAVRRPAVHNVCAGMAAYARSKDHDDRQCLNEGVALIMVSLN